MIGAVTALFNKKEMYFSAQWRLKSERRIERNDRRTRFSAHVFARSGKSVNI